MWTWSVPHRDDRPHLRRLGFAVLCRFSLELVEGQGLCPCGLHRSRCNRLFLPLALDRGALIRPNGVWKRHGRGSPRLATQVNDVSRAITPPLWVKVIAVVAKHESVVRELHVDCVPLLQEVLRRLGQLVTIKIIVLIQL